MQKLTHEQLLARQHKLMSQPRIPLIILLNNIRSLHNVGSIFRTSDGIGVEKIWLCGITGCPPHHQISKTALDAEQRVPWDHSANAVDVVKALKKDGYRIVALEQTDKSLPYQNYTPKPPTCLIVGNEVEGVDGDLMPYCDDAIEIEMAGLKNSLNVAVASGIVLYHFRHELLKLT